MPLPARQPITHVVLSRQLAPFREWRNENPEAAVGAARFGSPQSLAGFVITPDMTVVNLLRNTTLEFRQQMAAAVRNSMWNGRCPTEEVIRVATDILGEPEVTDLVIGTPASYEALMRTAEFSAERSFHLLQRDYTLTRQLSPDVVVHMTLDDWGQPGDQDIVDSVLQAIHDAAGRHARRVSDVRPVLNAAAEAMLFPRSRQNDTNSTPITLTQTDGLLPAIADLQREIAGLRETNNMLRGRLRLIVDDHTHCARSRTLAHHVIALAEGRRVLSVVVNADNVSRCRFLNERNQAFRWDSLGVLQPDRNMTNLLLETLADVDPDS